MLDEVGNEGSMAGEAEIAKFTYKQLIRRGKDLVRACHVPSVKLN